MLTIRDQSFTCTATQLHLEEDPEKAQTTSDAVVVCHWYYRPPIHGVLQYGDICAAHVTDVSGGDDSAALQSRAIELRRDISSMYVGYVNPQT